MPKSAGAMSFTILIAALLITGCANPFQKACEVEIISSEDVGRYAYKYFGEGILRLSILSAIATS